MKIPSLALGLTALTASAGNAAPIAVYICTDTGKQFKYFTPDSFSNAAIYRTSSTPNSWYVLRDLVSQEDSIIRLWVVGTKKYYHVNFGEFKKWSTVEVEGYPNRRRGTIRYPGNSSTVTYELDGSDLSLPDERYWSRETSFVFGVRSSVSVGGFSQSIPLTIGGNGSYWYDFHYDYVAPPAGQTALYPYDGQVVDVRNYSRVCKYSSTNSNLSTVGSDKTVNGEVLKAGTRGYSAYIIGLALEKSGYKLVE
jgi:hypothetical protein